MAQSGPVSVLASVSGPMEVRLRDELVDRAALEVNIRPVKGLPGPSTKALVDSIESILAPILLLNRHPRSLIQLSLQTVSLPSTRYSKPFRTFTEASATAEDDDERVIDEDLASSESQPESVAEKAAAINAAVCSLVDAAIGMKAMVCAAGLAVLRASSADLQRVDAVVTGQQYRIVLDPTAEEERDAQATLCVAFAYGLDVGGEDGDVCYLDMAKGFVEEAQVRRRMFGALESVTDVCYASWTRQCRLRGLRAGAFCSSFGEAKKVDISETIEPVQCSTTTQPDPIHSLVTPLGSSHFL